LVAYLATTVFHMALKAAGSTIRPPLAVTPSSQYDRTT
jgi:hypothetical protein